MTKQNAKEKTWFLNKKVVIMNIVVERVVGRIRKRWEKIYSYERRKDDAHRVEGREKVANKFCFLRKGENVKSMFPSKEKHAKKIFDTIPKIRIFDNIWEHVSKKDCVLLGVSQKPKSYKLFDLIAKKIVVSKVMIF